MKNLKLFSFIIIFLISFILISAASPAPTSELGIPSAAQMHLDETNINAAINYIKNIATLDKEGVNIASTDSVKDSKSLWGAFVNPGNYPSFGDSKEVQIKEAQKRIWAGLNSEDRKKFLMTVMEKKGFKIDPTRLNGLDSKDLTWDGSKLNTKSGAYLDFNQLPKTWLKEIDYREGKLVCKFDSQNSGKKEDERTIILEGKGTINNNGILIIPGITDFVSDPRTGIGLGEINILYGTGGTIRLTNNEKIALLDGANLKIGNNFYKQFYGIKSSYDAYKPENGKDEESIIGFYKGSMTPSGSSSPSDKSFIFPEVKNAIVSVVSKEGVYAGDIYTSRMNSVKIINNDEKYFNPSKVNFDPVYDLPFSSDQAFVEINKNSNGKYDLKMVGNTYIGFIAQKGVDIENVFLQGQGDLVKDKLSNEMRGEFIYFKNGDQGVSVEKGQTYMSGPSKLVASVDSLVNGRDMSKNIKQVNGKEGSQVIVESNDGVKRVVYNYNNDGSNLWKDKVKVQDIQQFVTSLRNKIFTKISEETRTNVPTL
jgi:predicted small secreted protein